MKFTIEMHTISMVCIFILPEVDKYFLCRAAASGRFKNLSDQKNTILTALHKKSGYSHSQVFVLKF
jgi:hypothetical protein